MAQQPNLFPLKLFVISLGFVLIGGTILLCGVIANKAGKALAAESCTDAALSLHGKGRITSITPQGDKVQVTLAASSKTELLTIDRCSGKILQTLTIEP